MSRTQVDFSLVRYSPIEGTHYFYDPNHPTAVQFLVNGQWEPWDVGWVKFKAQDPDIRRIAEDAEAQLMRASGSSYTNWPSAPPPELTSDEVAQPTDLVDPALLSPLLDEVQSPTLQDDLYQFSPIDDSPPPPPQTYQPSAASAPPQQTAYTSPYAVQPPPPASFPDATTAATSATLQAAPEPPAAAVPNMSNGVQQPTYPPPNPYVQPAAGIPILLSKNRETKILLSLDGDGIRGLSQVLLVESLVNAICTKIGGQVDPYQIFDLIGGTSMGGVLGIMLTRLRMQAHRAREAYKLIAKEVFPNKRDFYSSFDPLAVPLTQDENAMENSIKTVVTTETGNQEDLLYDQRDDSADVFAVSTRIDIGTNKAALMRSFQTRRITGPELDANMTIWEAMRAAVAAPRYMHPRTGINWRPVIEPGLVDHGTAKNNPIRDLLYECRKLYRYANDQMVIVSLGTGTGIDYPNELAEMAKGVNDRNLEARVWGEKFETDHQALMERGWMKYFRFNVPDLDDVPLEEWCNEDLIKEKTLLYLGRPDIGQMFYACVDAITTVLLGGQHVQR